MSIEEGEEWDIDSIAYLHDIANVMYGEREAANCSYWVVENTLLYEDTDRQEIMDQLMNAHYEVYGTP